MSFQDLPSGRNFTQFTGECHKACGQTVTAPKRRLHSRKSSKQLNATAALNLKGMLRQTATVLTSLAYCQSSRTRQRLFVRVAELKLFCERLLAQNSPMLTCRDFIGFRTLSLQAAVVMCLSCVFSCFSNKNCPNHISIDIDSIGFDALSVHARGTWGKTAKYLARWGKKSSANGQRPQAHGSEWMYMQFLLP